MKDVRLVSKMEGERETNFSRRLKHLDGLTWLIPTPVILRHTYATSPLVVATDTDRPGIYDFLLVIHGDHFQEIATETVATKCEFSHPVYLAPRLRGHLLEFCNVWWAQKLEWWGYHFDDL